MKKPIFILASNSFLVRKGLEVILNKNQSNLMIKEAENAAMLQEILTHFAPELLVIDEPVFNAASQVFVNNTSLLEKTILIKPFTSESDQENVKEIIYLNEEKSSVIEKLEQFYRFTSIQHQHGDHAELSEREKTILKFVSRGMTNKEIADNLFLSVHTVITHRKNISNKLGIKSVSGLTVYAIVNNIITIDEISDKNE